jgi:hypothetical protein
MAGNGSLQHQIVVGIGGYGSPKEIQAMQTALTNRLLTAPEGNGVRMIYHKSIMAGLVAVFSVLLFVDRAPDPAHREKRDVWGTPQRTKELAVVIARPSLAPTSMA